MQHVDSFDVPKSDRDYFWKALDFKEMTIFANSNRPTDELIESDEAGML